jgi:hypothetical protein
MLAPSTLVDLKDGDSCGALLTPLDVIGDTAQSAAGDEENSDQCLEEIVGEELIGRGLKSHSYRPDRQENESDNQSTHCFSPDSAQVCFS